MQSLERIMTVRVLIPRNTRDEYLAGIQSLPDDVRVAELRVELNKYSLSSLLHRAIRRFSASNPTLRSIIASRQKPFARQFFIDDRLIDSECQSVDALLYTPSLHPSSLALLLPLLSNLKWIHSTFTGVDQLPLRDIRSRGIVLTSSVGVHGKRIAEFAMGLILALAKRIPEHVRIQQRKQWGTLCAEDLGGKVLGIIGYGNIGRRVASLANAFGMHVLATKRSPVTTDAATVLPPQELQRLLRESDFILISAPLTAETLELLGEKEFQVMKPNAFLINVARAQIVNEKALVYALRNKLIAGAAVDHFHRMPIPRSSALYGLSNLLVTHYSAFASAESHRELAKLFLENVNRFTAQRPLLSVVDTALGY